MVLLRRRALALAAALGTAVFVTALSSAQEAKPQKKAPAPDRNTLADDRGREFERASGVIVKVEPVSRVRSKDASDAKRSKGKDRASTRGPIRVTINTAAVWRDYVRDQAVNPAKAGDAKATKGENAVATKGEPQSPDTLVVVTVPRDARLAARFRSSTDEIDAGSPSVAGAEANETDPAEGRDYQRSTERRAAAKPQRMRLDDVKTGMFVQVEYRQDKKGKNEATSLVVLKAVGGPDTPARQEEPKK